MTIQEAINFVDIARMNYICDPQGCGLEKGKDPCTAFHCDEMHDALAMAIEALQIADKVRFEVEWLIDCEIANNGFLKASDAKTFAKSIVDFVLAQNEESGKRLADIRGDTK